jgi:uncharacterized protein (DUF1810 family)
VGGGVIKNKLVNENSLERFVLAQEECYEDVLSELREGRKRTHWMWFVFTQLKGLGQSENSDYFGLTGQDEARRYWDQRKRVKKLFANKKSINEENLKIMKTNNSGALKFSIFLMASVILFLSKNANAVDASNFSKIIYKAGSWQVVEIHAKTKVLYRIATDSLNVKDTHFLPLESSETKTR